MFIVKLYNCCLCTWVCHSTFFSFSFFRDKDTHQVPHWVPYGLCCHSFDEGGTCQCTRVCISVFLHTVCGCANILCGFVSALWFTAPLNLIHSKVQAAMESEQRVDVQWGGERCESQQCWRAGSGVFFTWGWRLATGGDAGSSAMMAELGGGDMASE